MRPSPPTLRLLVLSALAWAGMAGTAASQQRDVARPSTGVVLGKAADSAGQSLSEVEIAILQDHDSVMVARGTTNSQRVARLHVPAGGPYTLLARKLGYHPIRKPGMYIREGDSLDVTVVMHPHIAMLPEVAAEATAPRAIARRGFFGIRLFKCLVIGIGSSHEENEQVIEEVEAEAGCRANANAHAARRAAREAAGEMARVMRRVEDAHDAGRRPDPREALLVLTAARNCSKEIPRRLPWPQHDPDVRCRELQKRVPQETLSRLGAMLVALDADDSFDAEMRRERERERRRITDERSEKLARLLAEAEARYWAREVQHAARRVEVATKAGRQPDAADAMLVSDAAEECAVEKPADEVLCRAIFKQTPRKTLGRLVETLASSQPTGQSSMRYGVLEGLAFQIP